MRTSCIHTSYHIFPSYLRPEILPLFDFLTIALPPTLQLQASFRTQAKALLRKNLIQQRRAVCTNIFIVLTPIFFCILLFVLQRVINNAIDKPENKCGCLCLNCCETDSAGVKTCRVPTIDNPCREWQDCEEYDENQCGFIYSDAAQASFCAVPSPSIWPALVSVPSPGFLAHPYSPDGAMLVTGQNMTLADSLKLFPDPKPTPEDQLAADSFVALGLQNVSPFLSHIDLHLVVCLVWIKINGK